MKKVIQGSLFNTETAKKIACFENKPERDADDYYCETLYKTKSGKYFLHGAGGLSSIYRTLTSMDAIHRYSSGPGEEIRPLSLRDAKAWAEANLDAERYMEVFEPIDEDAGPREALNLTVSPACRVKLERLRETQKLSMSAIVEHLVMEYKDKEGQV